MCKILSSVELIQFNEWFNDCNVIIKSNGFYATQDALYKNNIQTIKDLQTYFKNEFL